jgi:hypothetical protein
VKNFFARECQFTIMKHLSKIVLLLMLVSCTQQRRDAESSATTVPTEQGKEVAATDTSGITYQIIHSENGVEGFGYDIYIQGKLYVHQPSIPAIAGNKGFSSSHKAEQAAALVVNKIKNNILPPTVDVNELDSLHLLD